MKLKKIIIFIIVFLTLFLILNPDAFYIAGISCDQAKILLRSEDIDDILKNTNMENETIKQLKLVPEIMIFGNRIGFPETEAYSRYSVLDRDALYYSLSASRKDSFENYQWNWPLVGHLPYKGFIKIDDAKKEGLELRKNGYDIHIGKSRTMSSLGFLPDPVITPMINKNDPTELAYVIFHERTHQLFFKKNEVTFNENAAVLLGTLASLEFFEKKFGPGSDEYGTQKEKLEDIILFSNYIDNFYEDMNILYLKNISCKEKLSNRVTLFQQHADLFKTSIKPELKILFKAFDREEMNNAYIYSYYRYYGKVHIYIRVHEKLGNDINRTSAFFKVTANSDELSDDLIENFMNDG